MIFTFSVSRKLAFWGGGEGRIHRRSSIINPHYMKIGKDFFSLWDFRIEACDNFLNQEFFPEIVIKDRVSIGSNCHIGAINSVKIDDDVLIASNVFISDHSHGLLEREFLEQPPTRRELSSKGSVNIEKNVWIGEGVIILSGVTIGEGAVIGAHSLVTQNIPPYSIAAGTPAKIIKSV